MSPVWLVTSCTYSEWCYSAILLMFEQVEGTLICHPYYCMSVSFLHPTIYLHWFCPLHSLYYPSICEFPSKVECLYYWIVYSRIEYGRWFQFDQLFPRQIRGGGVLVFIAHYNWAIERYTGTLFCCCIYILFLYPTLHFHCFCLVHCLYYTGICSWVSKVEDLHCRVVIFRWIMAGDLGSTIHSVHRLRVVVFCITAHIWMNEMYTSISSLL